MSKTISQTPKTRIPRPKPKLPELTKDGIIRVLREHLPELRRDYGVSYLGLFGSYVRGEQDQRSDVDLLVEIDGTMGLFGYIDLERRLTKLVHKKVDLVMRDSLKPVIGIFIRREVIEIQ